MSIYEGAIEILKNNYPDKHYTMLREAVDVAMEVLSDYEKLKQENEELASLVDELTEKLKEVTELVID